MSDLDGAAHATVEQNLRLGTGFAARERAHLVARLGRLDERLKTFGPGSTDLELSVKGRETRSQQVTLECWTGDLPRLVATSTEWDLDAAVAEVRDDLVRQLNDAKTREEPRNSRRLRRR